jgi:hypothetical protein
MEAQGTNITTNHKWKGPTSDLFFLEKFHNLGDQKKGLVITFFGEKSSALSPYYEEKFLKSAYLDNRL